MKITYLTSYTEHVIGLLIAIQRALHDSAFLKAICRKFAVKFRGRSFKLFKKVAASPTPVSLCYRKNWLLWRHTILQHPLRMPKTSTGSVEKGALNPKLLRAVWGILRILIFNLHWCGRIILQPFFAYQSYLRDSVDNYRFTRRISSWKSRPSLLKQNAVEHLCTVWLGWSI